MNSMRIVSFAALAICLAHGMQESDKDYLNELTSAGISQETAQGIIEVGEKHKPDASDPNQTGRTIFEAVQHDIEEYIKSRPQEDQNAYNQYVQQKKNHFESSSAVGGGEMNIMPVEENQEHPEQQMVDPQPPQ